MTSQAKYVTQNHTTYSADYALPLTKFSENSVEKSLRYQGYNIFHM